MLRLSKERLCAKRCVASETDDQKKCERVGSERSGRFKWSGISHLAWAVASIRPTRKTQTFVTPLRFRTLCRSGPGYWDLDEEGDALLCVRPYQAARNLSCIVYTEGGGFNTVSHRCLVCYCGALAKAQPERLWSPKTQKSRPLRPRGSQDFFPDLEKPVAVGQ